MAMLLKSKATEIGLDQYSSAFAGKFCNSFLLYVIMINHRNFHKIVLKMGVLRHIGGDSNLDNKLLIGKQKDTIDSLFLG